LSTKSFLDHRRAGILLHPTSLPGDFATGDIGAEAYHFIDFLAASGMSVWQMLPLGPTHLDGSPYQCLSVHANNPQLIDLHWLQQQGWLDMEKVQQSSCSGEFRQSCLRQAYQGFLQQAKSQWKVRLGEWVSSQSNWLPDYALFMSIKQGLQGAAWNDWPLPLRLRDAAALASARKQCSNQIAQIEFEQFIFDIQWKALRDYAHERNILLFGDLPIYVSFDSADVWAARENFLLDENGQGEWVAGVPPDAFSELGQRWGNPLYNWDYQRQNNFEWWQQRMATQLENFDLIRIDHFRGFDACWHIAADESTAINGHWVKSPGRKLLQALYDKFGSLPLVAEDLGLITPEVIELREQFQLPGMKILQFAFDGDARNLYLPHNHQHNSVVYTGTHDNNTTLGWYQQLDPISRRFLHHYLGVSEHSALDMPWMMNRLAFQSVAQLAMVPMQDILNLDGSHRMNTPGTTDGNWQWRFEWSQLWPDLSADLKKLLGLYDRLV
jgi:4-alpha-glucanotransferase